MTISQESFVQETHLIYRIVCGETLLVNGITNRWHRLNEVGTQILERLKKPVTVKQIIRDLSAKFTVEEVSPEELSTDVNDFIEYLLQEQIIRADSRQPARRGLIRVDTAMSLMLWAWNSKFLPGPRSSSRPHATSTVHIAIFQCPNALSKEN